MKNVVHSLWDLLMAAGWAVGGKGQLQFVLSGVEVVTIEAKTGADNSDTP